ncbi:aspartic proteinase-like protein 2 isoform X1 [Tanacetum coccineum]
MTKFISIISIILIYSCYTSSGDEVFSGAVFGVNSKFSGKERSLSLLKAHDNLRHLQILAAGVDLPLGGTGRPDAVGGGAMPWPHVARATHSHGQELTWDGIKLKGGENKMCIGKKSWLKKIE